MVEKISAFFVGNVVGLTILVGGVLLTAPSKLKETEVIEKQKAALTEQAARNSEQTKEQVPQITKQQTAQSTKEQEPTKESSGNAKDSTNAQKTSTGVATPGNTSEKTALYVVSTLEILRGTKISATAVKLESLPTDNNLHALSDLHSVVGKTASVDIRAGSTIKAQELQ